MQILPAGMYLLHTCFKGFPQADLHSLSVWFLHSFALYIRKIPDRSFFLSAPGSFFTWLLATLVTPLSLPINPHVAELISCEECLRILPVEPVSTKHIVSEFCQNGGSLGVPSQILASGPVRLGYAALATLLVKHIPRIPLHPGHSFQWR